MKENYEVLEKKEQGLPKDKNTKDKLHKSSKDSLICGVCGGLAEYMNIDSTLIRILTVLLLFLVDGSKILLLYILLAVILPKA